MTVLLKHIRQIRGVKAMYVNVYTSYVAPKKPEMSIMNSWALLGKDLGVGGQN